MMIKEEDDEELLLNIPTIEQLLVIRDFISQKEGRKLTITETLDHMINEVAKKEGFHESITEYIKNKNL